MQCPIYLILIITRFLREYIDFHFLCLCFFVHRFIPSNLSHFDHHKILERIHRFSFSVSVFFCSSFYSKLIMYISHLIFVKKETGTLTTASVNTFC